VATTDVAQPLTMLTALAATAVLAIGSRDSTPGNGSIRGTRVVAFASKGIARRGI
jgi:hypothetical protein